MSKLQEKWGVSAFGVFIICIVFSLTGLTVVWAKPYVFQLFRYTDETPTWLKVVTYLLTIFPMYQIFLIIYGTLFGKFRFFWEKEKAMVRGIKRLFTGGSKPSSESA